MRPKTIGHKVLELVDVGTLLNTYRKGEGQLKHAMQPQACGTVFNSSSAGWLGLHSIACAVC